MGKSRLPLRHQTGLEHFWNSLLPRRHLQGARTSHPTRQAGPSAPSGVAGQTGAVGTDPTKPSSPNASSDTIPQSCPGQVGTSPNSRVSPVLGPGPPSLAASWSCLRALDMQPGTAQ